MVGYARKILDAQGGKIPLASPTHQESNHTHYMYLSEFYMNILGVGDIQQDHIPPS